MFDYKSVGFGPTLKEYLEFYHISQKEFAERLNITPKHLIDIINGNINLSSELIVAIALVTDIPVDYILNMEKSKIIDQEIDNYVNDKKITKKELINRFEYKELQSRNWLTFTNKMNEYTILEDILKYLRINSFSLLNKNDNALYKSRNDKEELSALWLERCYRLALKQTINDYRKDNIENIVNYIKDCAKNNILNEKELIKVFNSNGVILVIEDDLKGSKIRGAFKVLRDQPAIYITRKHKRYADIYFALLHELAHCKSDYNQAKSMAFVSTLDENIINDIEMRADNTALNWMIDNDLYNIIKNDYQNNSDKVIKSFLVYRLAKDKIISYSSQLYQKYNPTID